MVEINFQQLAPDILNNLLLEIVLREGTDYGEVERSTESKIAQLKSVLNSGKAIIMFDAVSNQCDIIEK